MHANIIRNNLIEKKLDISKENIENELYSTLEGIYKLKFRYKSKVFWLWIEINWKIMEFNSSIPRIQRNEIRIFRLI